MSPMTASLGAIGGESSQSFRLRRRRSSSIAIGSAFCIVAFISVRSSPRWSRAFTGFPFSTNGKAQDGQQGLSGRRELLTNLLPAAFFGGTAWGAQADSARAEEEQLDLDDGYLPSVGYAQNYGFSPCFCCVKDWCNTRCSQNGVSRKCDCHAFFQYKDNRRVFGNGNTQEKYKVPRNAEQAREESIKAGTGEEGWYTQVNWQNANLPRFYPETGRRLQVQVSELEGSKNSTGLFAKANLFKYAVLPPFIGKPMSVEELRKAKADKDSEHVWCPALESKTLELTDAELKKASDLGAETTFCIDATKSLQNNPARFVKAAETAAQCKEVNMQICDFGGVAYYRTTTDIVEGTELVADDGFCASV